MIWTVLHVAAGGALGAVGRFLVGLAVARWFGTGFPLGTLAVNVAGSFVMGALAVWLAERGMMRVAPFLMIGVLGGFTTFSAFSMDAVNLWQRGEAGVAVVYVTASVGLSIAALAGGMALMRGALG
jgi:CrcB protein